MLRPKTRWQQVEVEEGAVQKLVETLGIHPLIARLLVSRGIDDPVQAKQFLYTDRSAFYDPFLLDGMEEAVARIRLAVANNEQILIYGDYDADGVSSTSLLMRVLQQLEANVSYYIPNRFREGYGLNRGALEQAKQRGTDLVITVDTGISAVEEAAWAKQLGLDLIVTDHHEPPATLPDALAIINPKKPGCPYPFDGLAGAGVALKLAHALLGQLPEDLLDVVALGTIADLVPLVDENRVIASLGLQRMNERQHTGLTALMEVSGIKKEVTAGHVAFSLGPRVNAGGRLDSASQAVELLMTEEWDEAESLAKELDEMNKERQQLVEEIVLEAMAMVEQEPDCHRRFIVVGAPGWNVGVIGIVASRLVEKYYRPTIVMGIDPETGTAKGSARSIAGFDMYRALVACEDLLPHFGGHPMAAGMTLPIENLSLLHERLHKLADEWLEEADYIPRSRVDAELTLDAINLELIEQLEQLGPYGIGNPTPLFQLSSVDLERMQLIGQEKNHLKLTLKQGKQRLDAVGFRLGERAAEMTAHACPELLGELNINEWNGRRTPQMIIRDLSVPHVQVFDWRGNGDQTERLLQLAEDPETVFLALRERKGRAAWTEKLLSQLPVQYWDELEVDGELLKKPYRHLLFLDPPPSLQVFERLLAKSSHVERYIFAYGDDGWDHGLVGVPDRERFKRLYSCLVGRRETLYLKRDLHWLHKETGLSKRMISFMLQVFQELGFVREEGGGLSLETNPAKRPLIESRLYQRRMAQEEVLRTFVYSSYKELCAYLSRSAPFELDLGGTSDELQRENSGDFRLSPTGRTV